MAAVAGRLRSRVRRLTTYFPAFRQEDWEQEYKTQMGPHQIRSDLRTAFIGLFMQSVVVKKSGTQIDLPVAYSWMAVFCCLLPIVALLGNPGDYLRLRNRILMVWLIFVWFYGAKSAESADNLPPSNMLLLLLRSQVLQIFWSNVSLRLPFLLHVTVHAAVVIAISFSNRSYCRWASSQSPAPWLRKFVGTMRHVTLVKAPEKESLTASPLGMCMVAAGFFQILLGHVLPSCIALFLELQSRHNFLWQNYHGRSQRHGTSPGLWRPRVAVSWHSLWIGALAVAICWRLAEGAAHHLMLL